MALTFAYYLVQFLRLILSIFIVGFGYLVVSSISSLLKRGDMDESLLMLGMVGFAIVALIACNKLVDAVKAFQQKNYFTMKNKKAFEFSSLSIIGYVIMKYGLLLYIISIEKGKLAISDWWQDGATQPSELISLFLLSSFFWVIAKLIEEGLVYKDENDLTI